MSKKCYIQSMALVSCQKPLCDDWFTNPIIPGQDYVRAQEPDSKEFILPAEARRMSKILKRTICTAITALNNANISEPDAIITGTGMGCLENSEKFLIDLVKYGENCLKPTLFMQSTHNTISSLIAIVLKCHGYNNTYSHKEISFESSLLDGWLQIKSGMVRNALIGSHDEVTPFMSLVLKHTHPEYRLISETSMSMVISDETTESTIGEISGIELLHRADINDVSSLIGNDDNLLMLGTNGNPINDTPYNELPALLDNDIPTAEYKPYFGENFSASAAGLYVGATILARQSVPHFLWRGNRKVTGEINGVTILNCSEDSTWSIIKLKRI